MGWFDENHKHSQAHSQYNSAPKHKSHVTHELVAGAASFEAAKAYEDHVKRHGKPASHAKAKELAAGFAGAFIDKQFETHGLDFLDKEKAKHQAKHHTEEAVTKHGGY